jgi:hypothetical protein
VEEVNKETIGEIKDKMKTASEGRHRRVAKALS